MPLNAQTRTQMQATYDAIIATLQARYGANLQGISGLDRVVIDSTGKISQLLVTVVITERDTDDEVYQRVKTIDVW